MVFYSWKWKEEIADDVMENPWFVYYGKYLVKEYPEQVYKDCVIRK